jgi:hypothetical protein
MINNKNEQGKVLNFCPHSTLVCLGLDGHDTVSNILATMEDPDDV